MLHLLLRQSGKGKSIKMGAPLSAQTYILIDHNEPSAKPPHFAPTPPKERKEKKN